MTKTNNLHKNEQGFASIVIALILIIVLALLTVGFAQLARNEQQNALSKQLATQANYAAESGINDIYNAINNGTLPTEPGADATPAWPANLVPSDVIGTNAGTNCLSGTELKALGINNAVTSTSLVNINANAGVDYTCALVNLTPPTLVKGPAAPNIPWDTVFSTSDGSGNPDGLGSLTVTWSSADGHNAFWTGDNYSFPPNTTTAGGWNNSNIADAHAPALEFSITPLGGGTGTDMNRDSLINNTFTVYLYPSTEGGNSVNYFQGSSNSGSGQDGQIIPGACSTSTNSCSVNINAIPGSPGEYYLMDIVPLPYDTPNISVSAATAPTGGTTLDFDDAQVVIDVTGQAHNVLKRLHEVLPLNGVGGSSSTPGDNNIVLPEDALQAGNICKQFDTAPTTPPSGPNPNGTTFGTGTSTSPSCNLTN